MKKQCALVAHLGKKTIKKWKINIITEMNPDWLDLSTNWDLPKYIKKKIGPKTQLIRNDNLT